MNHRFKKRPANRDRSGIILLIVLSMLTFFSVMAAAYLVHSNQSRQTSYAIATRNIKQPPTNTFMEEALMLLIRGTEDKNSPMFGEDLLSDYYGRTDAMQISTTGTGTSLDGALLGGFVSVPVSVPGSTQRDDVLTGRIITFRTGTPMHRSFRVVRSKFITAPSEHSLVIELNPDLGPADIVSGLEIWVNGVPRNSVGIGYREHTGGTPPANVDMNVANAISQQVNGIAVGYNLPVALQPNHLPTSANFSAVDKSQLLQFDGNADGIPDGSDFDEAYDAADFNNWYLSHRHPDGKIIPSFHRPSVINYILNERSDWHSLNQTADFADVMASLARGTMRPIPISPDQFGTHPGLHERFTGGNANFALRVPINVNDASRLDQIARVLTGFVPDAYDVDNDSDGINDSVWIDMGLPVFTSPDGKLIKPLIAPMIEDLTGRLNVNAHSNFALVNATYGLSNSGSLWSGQPTTPFLLRGLGFGPAEINIPLDVGPDPAKYPTTNDLAELLQGRYQEHDPSVVGVPGTPGRDTLSLLMSRGRPDVFDATTRYPSSVDPYGRGGVGIAGSGNIVSTNTGIQLVDNGATTGFTEPSTFETTDNPYESDPTGRMSGDRTFTSAELEAVLKSNQFGSEMLSGRLRDLLQPFLNADPDFWRNLTTHSRSDESPAILVPGEANAFEGLRKLVDPTGTLTLSDAEWKALIAPELRLGNRLNVNRELGNGVDDNGNGVIDEPIEIPVETEAYQSVDGTAVPTRFQGIAPNYTLDDTLTTDPRQLLARHLYVLMMALSHSFNANDYPAFGDTIGAAPTIALDRDAYRARRMAQWAVNVVDFRDPDSIMTGFEYDENPFDGWDVDGDLLSNEGAFRKVVFGVESPDLVFTESLALHDVRVRDTDLETAGKKKGLVPGDDEDMDQVRIPQGSLFLELYCPRERVQAGALGPELSGFPAELYHVTPGIAQDYALDLTRTVNDATSGAQVPVWRIAISAPHFKAPEIDDSPLRLRNPTTTGLVDTLSFDPAQLDELGDNPVTLPLDRFVFFTKFSDRTTLANTVAAIPDISHPARVFFNHVNSDLAHVKPEQYLTLAPRTVTHVGSAKYVADPVQESFHRFEIEVDPSVGATRNLIQYDLGNTRITPATSGAAPEIKPGRTLVISTFPPSNASWPNLPVTAPEGIGLNVTEPLPVNPATGTDDYYAEPRSRYSIASATEYEQTDGYLRLVGGVPAVPTELPLDAPEDMRFDGAGRQLGPIYEMTVAYVGTASVKDPMLGSFPNFRTAFLQRVADPTRDFDPVTNPYRTIDQIPIDVTIFSGEDQSSAVTAPGLGTPPTVEADYIAGSRQRDGEQKDPLGTVTAMNVLHNYSTDIPTAVGNDTAATDYFVLSGGGGQLETTFNYLNSGFMPMQPYDALKPEIRGRPLTPFAMQPWLNRSFASPLELMLVPACSQARLFEEFMAVANTNYDPPVYPADIPSPTDVGFVQTFVAPYRHLLNFFHSHEVKLAGTPSTQYGMLFDLVGTPARFRGEVEYRDPARVNHSPLDEVYEAPFNVMDDNQRIGRINVNTLAEFDVYKGLMQGHANPLEMSTEAGSGADEVQLAFNSFLESRYGYSPTVGVEKIVTDTGGASAYNYVKDHLNPAYPTQFAGVFKPSVGGPFGPRIRDLPGTPPNESLDLRRRSSSAWLFRGLGGVTQLDPADGSAPTTVTPMFVRHDSQKPTAGAGPRDEFHLNRARNPVTRYQTLMRMPNLVTNNSQVFLIRMTMGYFEVDPNNIASLGREYNVELGKSQRFKAMFIVDRSIPVGFIPGRDVNARDVVIYESYEQ